MLAGESNSITNQKEILLKYAQDNHFPNTQFYVDDGWSGTNFNRPDFQRMITDMEAGKIGIIITKDLSRLGLGRGRRAQRGRLGRDRSG